MADLQQQGGGGGRKLPSMTPATVVKPPSMTPAQFNLPGPEWVVIQTETFGTAESGLLAAIVLDAKPLGGGGIDPQQRPGRRALTPYHNPDPPGFTLSLLFDGWPQNRSVERDCRTIERMAGMFLANDPGPERLIVRSQSIPHCHGTEWARRRWVIADPPEWGDSPEVIRRRRDGARLRQQVGLTILLATDADQLERLEPRQAKPKHRTIRARKGDTYLKIAKRELGNQRFGQKLARLNGARDPHKKLKEGTRVKLPSASELANWKRDLKSGK